MNPTGGSVAPTLGRGGLSWRVAGRFVDYVLASEGCLTASGGAEVDEAGMPSWPLLEDALDRAGRVRFAGEVRFSAHFGALDVALTEPELEVDGGVAALRVRTAYGDPELARSAWRELTPSGGFRVFLGDGVELAAEAVPLFGGVYPAGMPLDPFVVAVPAAPRG